MSETKKIWGRSQFPPPLFYNLSTVHHNNKNTNNNLIRHSLEAKDGNFFGKSSVVVSEKAFEELLLLLRGRKLELTRRLAD